MILPEVSPTDSNFSSAKRERARLSAHLALHLLYSLEWIKSDEDAN